MTAYFKLSGAGNDFLALVEPPETPSAAEIRAWCRRGVSLGADGVFVLSRTPSGVRMTHFNADGGRADLCLNGSRCAARLALHLGWDHAGGVTLETDAGSLAARPLGENLVELELPPIVGEPQPAAPAVGDERYEGWAIRVGVPHFVLPWPESLVHAPVRDLGRELRSHPDLGAAGANVDFVRFVARRRFEIRTFERGVEDETLACGTGVVAAAAAGVAADRLDLPASALTSAGFELTVDGEVQGGRLIGATLAGDARILARGEIFADSGVKPPASAARVETP